MSWTNSFSSLRKITHNLLPSSVQGNILDWVSPFSDAHLCCKVDSLWEWHIQHVHGVSHSWLGKKLMLLILLNYFGTFWIHCLLLLIDSFVLQNENVNREASSLQMYQHTRHPNRLAETRVLTSKTFNFRETIWSTFFNINKWCLFCFPLHHSFCDNYN